MAGRRRHVFEAESCRRRERVTPSVQIHSDGAGGEVKTITLTKTGTSAATIVIASSSSPATPETFNVYGVTADPTKLTLNCTADVFFSHPQISVVVSRQPPPAVAIITISHAIFGNGTYRYPLRAGEDGSVLAFLQQAQFPPFQTV
jgi:hypothetical protein